MDFLRAFAVAVLLAVGVFGDGHGHTPGLKVKVVLENSMFKFYASMSQKFPNDGEPSRAEHMINLMKAENMQSDLFGVRVYAVWSEIKNCTMFDPTMMEHIYNMTSDIELGNITRPSMNASMGEMDVHDGEPLIFPISYSQIVLQVNGMNFCLKPEVEEDHMQTITLGFPACADFTPKALREHIHEMFDIDMKRVFVGMLKYDGACMHVKVYFQHVFDNQAFLYKMKTKLTSKFEFGRYSPSDKCKTNLRESFLADKALQMCFSAAMETKKDDSKNLPTCVGMSREAEIAYNQRIMKYDCLVEEYAKKYGVNIDGCVKTAQQKQQASQSCPCASSDEAVRQGQYLSIMTHIQAPLISPELTAKKAELTKMMSMSNFDHDKFAKLADQIKNLEMEQAEYYFKTYFGFCIVAGHGDGAMELLNRVKEQVAAGMSEDAIVGQVVKTTITYYLSHASNSPMMSNMSMNDRKDDIKRKLMMLLKMDNGCMTADDRARVYKTIMDFAKHIATHVAAFNELVDNERIANLTREIVQMVEENPEHYAQMAFLMMLSPMEIADDNKLVMALLKLSEAFDGHKMMMAQSHKIQAWIERADVMDLINFLIIVMNSEDAKKECDFSDLVKNVQPYVNHMSGMGQNTGNSYGNNPMSDGYYGGYHGGSGQQGSMAQGYGRGYGYGPGYGNGRGNGYGHYHP